MTLGEARILVVDDEPVLRLTFALLLQQHGALVYTAANGAEALQMLDRERIDVILLDQHMPVMDGKTLLHTMLSDGYNIPSILFAANELQADPHLLHRLNVVATASKPLHPVDLIGLLTQVLQTIPASL